MSFNRFPHPCVVMDVLDDVWVDEVIEILFGVFVMGVRDGVVIGTLSDV